MCPLWLIRARLLILRSLHILLLLLWSILMRVRLRSSMLRSWVREERKHGGKSHPWANKSYFHIWVSLIFSFYWCWLIICSWRGSTVQNYRCPLALSILGRRLRGSLSSRWCGLVRLMLSLVHYMDRNSLSLWILAWILTLNIWLNKVEETSQSSTRTSKHIENLCKRIIV